MSDRRVSFFVQQGTDGNLARASRWLHEKGWLDKVYLQVHGNVDSTILPNLRMWTEWCSTLGRDRVYAWFWGSPDAGADAALVEDLRDRLNPSPAGWVPNDEIPTHLRDRSAMLAACEPDRIIASCAGYPEITPIDARHYAQYGAEVEWQCYNPDGALDARWDPGVVVPAIFKPPRLIARDVDHPAAWWYRVYFDNLASGEKRWAWLQALHYDPAGRALVVKEGANTWWTEATPHEYGFVPIDRIVRHRKTGRKVGIIFGTVSYPKIRIALGVERPTEPEALAGAVRRARVEGAAIRGITLYTLDNATDAHVAAIVDALN